MIIQTEWYGEFVDVVCYFVYQIGDDHFEEISLFNYIHIGGASKKVSIYFGMEKLVWG